MIAVTHPAEGRKANDYARFIPYYDYERLGVRPNVVDPGGIPLESPEEPIPRIIQGQFIPAALQRLNIFPPVH
jgi:hypothetical protein